MSTPSNDALADYQKDFINFLVASDVLTFGDFTTKSGRKTPYFVNTGKFDTGSKIHRLGKYYATHIQSLSFPKIDSIFGPAYKGVPLAVTASAALFDQYQIECGFTFNRKEEKTHGDGGKLVGKKLADGDKVLIVEDVITAGTTLREIVPAIRSIADIDVLGVVIAVDRCEKGAGELSAAQEAKQELGIEIFPIVNVYQIVEHLSAENSSGYTLPIDIQDRIQAYLEEYAPRT